MTFDLDTFLALPRVAGLALSPDGTRLVTSVATVAPDGKRFATAIWALDPAGEAAPRRLTRSAKGESSAAFLPDGSLLFTSGRPDPQAKADAKDDEERARLWLLPAGAGEARLVADPPAGVDGMAVAREAGTVALGVGVFPGAETLEEDGERFEARKEAGVKAQLFETYPIRNWDHYLGPRERRLFVADPPDPDGGDSRLGELRPVATDPGHGLDDMSFDLTPDGSTLVTAWRRDRDIVMDLVAVDTAAGERRLLADGDVAHYGVRCSPDGRFVACGREVIGTPEQAHRAEFVLVDLETGEVRDPAPGVDLDPTELAWAPDSGALFFVADERGRAPVFRLDLASGAVTRLSAAGAFSDLCPSPDGTTVYALRSTPTSPPGAVALDATAADQEPRSIPTPGLPLSVPGRLEELTAAADGTEIRSWLLMPEDAGPSNPAPMAVWIHGGPRSSWNSAWHWRWNPHVLVERGYAVLMPDPALSTGYGQVMLERGWGRWGDEPYTDVMAAVDAALERPDLDGNRVAAMGGSFGGYMANWVAGHTDRFRCIVTHASLWALDQFHGTTDHGLWWEREFGDPYRDTSRYEAHSPHRHVGRITTPMLVIHGELDHRVPVGEALRLWTDLSRHGVEAKFLYFPDENHWILKPQHARVWYETVLAWLDHHLLGKEWERPALL
jgi:dipeptidyl aminopeptidase/acylaminoacyl peptidase